MFPNCLTLFIQFVTSLTGDSIGVVLPNVEGVRVRVHVCVTAAHAVSPFGAAASARDICFLEWSANTTRSLQWAHTELADSDMWTFVLDVGGALRAHPRSESAPQWVCMLFKKCSLLNGVL